jgi:antitoxin ParD1/3/4
MPTRNVVLTDHQAHFVEQLVSSGRYQNASEVLREGLRLVERRESEDAMSLSALRDAAKIGALPTLKQVISVALTLRTCLVSICQR